MNFEKLLVFGDGLNDMGRWGTLTNKRYPPASVGFMDGRWTNGRVWVEHFAEALSLPLSFENNFAMGGATTGYYNINEPLRTLLQLDSNISLTGMLKQVQQLLESGAAINAQTLCVLWAGGHDIGNFLEYGQPDLNQYPPADNYALAVGQLVQAGVRHIMVSTMPDMGSAPGYFGSPKQAAATLLCQSLNAGLQQLKEKYLNTDVHYYLFDGAGVFARVGTNPAAYGFEHTEAFLPFDIIDFSNPLGKPKAAIPNRENGLNPDLFMNWWAVSASTRMHQILADEAIAFVQLT